MQTFELRAESPDSPQHRTYSVEAASEADARSIAEAKEHALVDFTLMPPSKDVWENPRLDGEADAHVDLRLWDQYDPLFARETATHTSYSEAQKAAKRRIGDWAGRVDVRDGKVRASTLGGRSLARLLAHRQEEPYNVVDCRVVSADETVAQVESYAGARRMYELAQRFEANPPEGLDPATWAKVQTALREGGLPLNAVTAILFGVPWQKQIDGSSVTVYSSATVQCSLHTGLTAVQDTDDFFNDVSASEITGTGYTAKGATLASKTSTYDTASDQVRLDAADVSWTTSTLSATDAVIWVDTAGASSTDPVWSNVDFGATVTTTAGTFQITLDATGHAVFDVT